MFTSYLITSTMTDTKCTLYTHNEWSNNPALAVTNAKYCSLHPLQINLICKYSPNLLMKSEDDRLLSIMLLCIPVGYSSQLSRGWPGARKELEYHLGIKKGLKVVHGSIYHTHADMSKI